VTREGESIGKEKVKKERKDLQPRRFTGSKR